MMRRVGLALLLAAAAATTHAEAAGAPGVVVYGKPDGNVPGWAITTDLLPGWTKDCCTYAAAIGVNLVLYQGEWTGKPDRVMVLNVWPVKLPTLDAELQDDRKHYVQLDPNGKVEAFPVANPPSIACQGVMYHGSDHVDDVVVFCDPGKATGIHYSWSMTVGAADPLRQSSIDAFKQVVEHSGYMHYVPTPASKDKAVAH
ncbi:hypothetical protein ISN74_15950 [Dyella caseinilytica]|uniref:Uncharacterized protein n=2 Tax=Dyella caseinilytica TaxID=1849581 RepID=A0ABX7GR60_9GAMM|nr:hypothetical protein ISN74_15950 [Dyella caseinilytica]